MTCAGGTRITYARAAALLLSRLEELGVTVTLREDGELSITGLNEIPEDAGMADAQTLSTVLHAWTGEIAAILKARQQQPTSIMPAEATALLVTLLEARGATFTLKPDHTFLCDLDSVTDFSRLPTPEGIARAVLGLRNEIRNILVARRTSH